MSEIKAPTKEDIEALQKVLALAENHQMWTSSLTGSPSFKNYADDHYAAINRIRDYLEANGFETTRSLINKLSSLGIQEIGPVEVYKEGEDE